MLWVLNKGPILNVTNQMCLTRKHILQDPNPYLFCTKSKTFDILWDEVYLNVGPAQSCVIDTSKLNLLKQARAQYILCFLTLWTKLTLKKKKNQQGNLRIVDWRTKEEFFWPHIWYHSLNLMRNLAVWHGVFVKHKPIIIYIMLSFMCLRLYTTSRLVLAFPSVIIKAFVSKCPYPS